MTEEHKFGNLTFLVRNDTDRAIIQEVWAQKVYGDAFQPGDRVIDIGAQIGSFSMLAAQKGAIVEAYEPDLANYAVLAENIARNDFSRSIKAYNMAVWSSPGTIKLFDSCSDNLGAHSAVFARNPERFTEVPCDTLESVFARAGWDEAEFLKMDCEGAEFEIVKSPAIKRVKKFSMEFHGFAYKKEDYDWMIEHLSQWFDVAGNWHEVISYVHGTRR